jgi:hypothetical protein
MPPSSKFSITRQVLAEMQQIASKSQLDTSRLDYSEVQQVLTLHSLIKLLASYQIDLEIVIDIKELMDDKQITRT